MFRKPTTLLLTTCIAIGLTACNMPVSVAAPSETTTEDTQNKEASEEQEAKSEPVTHEVSSEVYPLYFDTAEGGDMKLYFLDGVQDLPYVEINDFMPVLNDMFDNATTDVSFSISTEDHLVTITRADDEKRIEMAIDFDKNSIEFIDYNLFCQKAGKSTIMDTTSINVFNDAGEPTILQKVDKGTYTRFGDALEFKLGDYGIDLIDQDGLYLIPLQTISDILMAPASIGDIYFNGKYVITSADVNGCSDLYYSVPKGERSEALTEYGYNELCMMLDYFYGLKENHKIESFDKLFNNVGFDVILKGQDVNQADRAIYRTITDFLDDNHSDWSAFSYLSGPDDYKSVGSAKTKIFDHLDNLQATRDKYYPDGVPGYEEVGNTAYITFDGFNYLAPDADMYYTEDLQEIPDEDTIALIAKAHKQITRENSPIENVVLDLSENLGGVDDAAIFTIAWFLGEASLSQTDDMTGAMCTTTYRADVNLDRVFDEKDTVSDKNLFCLISPSSFSCGNLVPCVFKDSGKVTLLGRTSGGGCCSVMSVSSAWGTSFKISSNQRMSFLKNGAFYDVDRGADPDYVLSNANKYYDRVSLTSYINSLN